MNIPLRPLLGQLKSWKRRRKAYLLGCYQREICVRKYCILLLNSGFVFLICRTIIKVALFSVLFFLVQNFLIAWIWKMNNDNGTITTAEKSLPYKGSLSSFFQLVSPQPLSKVAIFIIAENWCLKLVKSSFSAEMTI